MPEGARWGKPSSKGCVVPSLPTVGDRRAVWSTAMAEPPNRAQDNVGLRIYIRCQRPCIGGGLFPGLGCYAQTVKFHRTGHGWDR